jgi:hypothetical protein
VTWAGKPISRSFSHSNAISVFASCVALMAPSRSDNGHADRLDALGLPESGVRVVLPVAA